MGAQGLCGSSAGTSGVEALDTALALACRSERFRLLLPLPLSGQSCPTLGDPMDCSLPGAMSMEQTRPKLTNILKSWPSQEMAGRRQPLLPFSVLHSPPCPPSKPARAQAPVGSLCSGCGCRTLDQSLWGPARPCCLGAATQPGSLIVPSCLRQEGATCTLGRDLTTTWVRIHKMAPSEI